MKQVKIKQEIIKKKADIFYLENININYSFSTLEKIARELGAKVDNGDILIADNPNRTKRKIFKKIGKNKYVILYITSDEGNIFWHLENGKQGSMVSFLE